MVHIRSATTSHFSFQLKRVRGTACFDHGTKAQVRLKFLVHVDSVEGDEEDASHDDVRVHLDEHIFVRLRLGRVRESEERGKLGSIGRWPLIRKMA